MSKKTTKTTKTTKNRGGRKPGTWISGLTIEAIKGLRRDSKLSRGKLSKLLGVSATTIQNWETGRVVPMKVYQQELQKLIKSGITETDASKSNSAAKSSVAAKVSVTGRTSDALDCAACEATSKIVVTYLESGKAKLGPDQLCKLVRDLRVAMQ